MTINFVELLYAVSEYMTAEKEYISYSKRVHPYGYRLDSYDDPKMNWLYEEERRAASVLASVSRVTCIPCDVLKSAARIVNRYEERHDWQVCFPSRLYERLVMGLLEEWN